MTSCMSRKHGSFIEYGARPFVMSVATRLECERTWRVLKRLHEPAHSLLYALTTHRRNPEHVLRLATAAVTLRML
eukprot:CAMPEP_0174710846 /NCGR_PEP_ID=MMETSP1094-20130205/12346_1 /TAXON_ID=156173 /ORGANISM="Chrysochromulina brevifilum, Strain UTEX LB 985" /LENGTH=74 /DNA_ID=CAMNT_0015909701 /DNA_START=98 /DNA_END=322 /DNA_ORIENTATION=+